MPAWHRRAYALAASPRYVIPGITPFGAHTLQLASASRRAPSFIARTQLRSLMLGFKRPVNVQLLGPTSRNSAGASAGTTCIDCMTSANAVLIFPTVVWSQLILIVWEA